MKYKMKDRRGGQLVKDAKTGKEFIRWNVAKRDGNDDGYVVIEKDDPVDELDHAKHTNRDAKERAASLLRNKLKNKKLAEEAAANRRDKMRSVSKGIDQMSLEDGIVAVSKAMLSDVHYRPRMLERKDFYRKLCELSELLRQDGQTKE
jgi:hypothetical protein